MIALSRIAPLVDLVPPERPLRPNKETALAFNKGAIFVLLDVSRGAPALVEAFKFENFRLTDEDVRWTLTNLAGRWWDGAMQELDIHRSVVFLRPANPIMSRPTPWGTRAVFKFRLPGAYRVMHLAQFRRQYPRIADLHPELVDWH